MFGFLDDFAGRGGEEQLCLEKYSSIYLHLTK